MRVVSTIEEVRNSLCGIRNVGQMIGFVPTMGYLHRGHMELIARAKKENSFVVVSIFVNPLQFGPAEDLEKYPRDIENDSVLLRSAGVDLLFSPTIENMYPRPMATVVDTPLLSKELEGEVRPGHFAGVATVVCKLLNIVQPRTAYFGEKDYQQFVIIQRMVEDLAIPVEVKAVPTVRDRDGLALSSRNVYLTGREREAASVVPRALAQAELLIAGGVINPDVLEQELCKYISAEPLADPEVVAVRDPENLTRLQRIDGLVLIALYVRIGLTKLLDNRVIDANLLRRDIQ